MTVTSQKSNFLLKVKLQNDVNNLIPDAYHHNSILQEAASSSLTLTIVN